MAAELSKIAIAAGQNNIARELITDALPHLYEREYLRSALDGAREIADLALAKACRERLDRLFPASAQERLIDRLLQENESPENGDVAEPGLEPDIAAFREFLLSALAQRESPDYDEIIQNVSSTWPSLTHVARLACAQDGLARGLTEASLPLSAPSDFQSKTLLVQRAAYYHLESLKRLLVSRSGDFDAEVVRRPSLELVNYLANHPSDAEMRVSFARALSVQSSGLIGISVLAVIILSSTEGQIANPGVPSPKREVSEETFKQFFEGALVWLAKNSPLNIMEAALPKELLPASPDSVFDVLVRLMQRVGELEGEAADLEFLEKAAFIAVLLAPHTSTPNEDLVVLRLAAGRFAMSGKFQRARDFAEHALATAGDDPLRRRLAWYGFADTYQRCNNLSEALMGMACALACRVPIPVEQAWYEANGLIRLLRDLGLVDYARSVLPYARKLLDDGSFTSDYAHRLETLDIGLRFRELATGQTQDPEDVLELVNQCTANCDSVLDRKDEILPSATLLAQAIRLANLLRSSTPPTALQTLNRALSLLHPEAAQFVRSISKVQPESADVLQLAHRLQRSRYAEDAGYDVRAVVLAAKRLLGSPETLHRPEVAALAIELLADHTVGRPKGADEDDGHWLASSADAASKFMCNLSATGLSVSLLGLDSAGHLVHVSAREGGLGKTAVESTTTFSESRLGEWSKQYPFEYGIREDEGNLFYTSMNGLGMNLPAADRLLIVADIRLQQLPPNLLLARDELIGRSTAVASAPSLAWLAAARKVKPSGQRRICAWIPTDVDDQGRGTLELLAARLEPTLQSNGVSLETGKAVPSDFPSADLAIVGAHGSVSDEGRYFQVINDEAGSKFSPISLAQAIGGARVVILFICSGGRHDQHPLSSATIGLPREILDRGSLAVLASPWPLSVSVAGHWLPSFLKSWSEGLSVIDANFSANKAVESALGNAPTYCLAMNLYGEPFTARL